MSPVVSCARKCMLLRAQTDELWFLPLGGCGEIGMNLNLYGHDEHWLMVDCGITFAKPGQSEPKIQMADPRFIAEQRDNLVALVVTHAHEDHIGAITYLWKDLQCPIYVTRFAAEILHRKLLEAGLLSQVPVSLVQSGQICNLAPFEVEFLDVDHSTPESQALMIRTNLGSIFHTGDWKIDTDPVLTEKSSTKSLRTAVRGPVLAMICDSTNALVPGHSSTEGSLVATLDQLVSDAPGRVVISCFGSNIARLHTLASIARNNNRYAGLLGRSLYNYHRAAVNSGLWDDKLTLIEPDHLGYLPRHEVLAIATGSQGEERAALDRLANNTHANLSLEPGDTVIMSSRVIPGNELSVADLSNRLDSNGINIITDNNVNTPIHASGHPAIEELADLYRWVQPEIVIPVHGTRNHMIGNAEVAKSQGIKTQLVGKNGDLFMLMPQVGIRRGAVSVGRLGVDAKGKAVPLNTQIF